MNSTPKISVVIVDDHEIVTLGLVYLLSTTQDIEVVGTATDGKVGVEMVLSKVPDVVLMDLSMPELDGISAIRSLVIAGSPARIMVLSSSGDSSDIQQALAAGAGGYLLKHSEPSVILNAIRSIAQGGAPLDPVAGSVLLRQQNAPETSVRLSPRELEVLRLLAKGFANKQIAARLKITDRTVKAHLTRIFHQLGVSDRTHAALWATKHGFDSDRPN
jgi:DNA-binding NarL/FixJ family response regulator